MTIEEIKLGETDRLEFKREVPQHDKRYLKTVVAFANGLGGSVVFGIDDKTLDVVGVPDDDLRKMEDGLASAISSACTPAIVPSFSRETVDSKTLLVVDIYPGRNTPYHIKAEGLDGVYVRVGATTRKAEREQIEELILRGGNRTFDAVILENETASESAMTKLCRRIGAAHKEHSGERIKVTPLMLEGWGVVRKTRALWRPSVAFRWLAANNDHFARVQCALFADDERTEFLDRQEYSGSVIDQVEESMKFVLRSIRRGAKIEGLYRKDFYELPPEALREAIVNAVAHRDYRQHAYIQVSVSPSKVEIVSPGSLFDGLTKEEMLTGKSKLRNPILADIFHKMGIIEKWGTGLRRIFSKCEKAGVEAPVVDVGGSTVTVAFLRKNGAALDKEVAQKGEEVSQKSGELAQKPCEVAQNRGELAQKGDGNADWADRIVMLLNDVLPMLRKDARRNAELVLCEIARNNEISIGEIREKTKLPEKTIKNAQALLRKVGILCRVGGDRGGHWMISWKGNI